MAFGSRPLVQFPLRGVRLTVYRLLFFRIFRVFRCWFPKRSPPSILRRCSVDVACILRASSEDVGLMLAYGLYAYGLPGASDDSDGDHFLCNV